MHPNPIGPVNVPTAVILLLVGAWISGFLAGLGAGRVGKGEGSSILPKLRLFRSKRRRGSYFRSDDVPPRGPSSWRTTAAWVSVAAILAMVGVSTLLAASNMQKGKINAAAGYRH